MSVVLACYVGLLPCTYDDSSGRTRLGLHETIDRLDLQARELKADEPRRSRHTRDFPTEGPHGETFHFPPEV